MKIVESKAIFNSGREANCNNGFIGINLNLEISEGSDGNFHIYDEEYENEELTTEEKIELADFMINQWQHYKNIAKLKLHKL